MPIRWGLIGASNIARQFVIDAIRSQPDGVIESVMSSDAGRAAAYARENGIERHFDDVEDILSSDIDAVYVSTTNDRHLAQVLAAAKAGKHILCEKPLALNTRDALTMVEACREAGVTMGTNHHLRGAGSHRVMRQAIAGGMIGEPIAARVFHAIYLPLHMQGWRLDKPDLGGGIAVDVTVHAADTLRFILDDDPTEITAVMQSSGMASSGLSDGIMTAGRFRSGLIAQTHGSYAIAHAGTGLEVHGTRGSLIGRNVMSPPQNGTLLLRNEKGEVELPFERENPYVVTLRDFHRALRGQGKPAASGEDGVWSLAVAEAAEHSARSGISAAISYPGVRS